MTGKEKYYALDEFRFVGNYGRTEAQVKRDIKRMVQFIKDEKAGKKNSASRRIKRVSKSK